MKVFIVFAHPEHQSLNFALLRVAIEELESQGNEVKVSDLYEMKWKSQADRADFPNHSVDKPLKVAAVSKEATLSETLTDDVKAEQEKLLWADMVILQFPIWWYAMPAILKGWVDRVYSCGFAYGLGAYNDKHWGDRYGEGKMFGKRAMLAVTTGSRKEPFSARGIVGPIDDVLYPMNHGMLFYFGFSVLPPFVVHSADRIDDQAFRIASDKLRQRMRTLESTKPIPFRPQNGGDYEMPTLLLRPGLEKPNATGFALHISSSE